jgi:signal transduction histidine kinase
MLYNAGWPMRIAGFAVVGLIAFLAPTSSHAALTMQIAAYAAMAVAVGLWVLTDVHAGFSARLGRNGLPVLLGVIAAAACLGGAGGGGGGNLIAFGFVAAMSAGTELELPQALAVGAAGLLAVEAGAVVFDSGLGTVFGVPLLLLAGLSIGRNRRGYRVQAEQSALLLAQYERLRAEQRRADVLDERTRIAREIHDVLAHSLGALGIQIQAARAVLTDQGDVAKALETLATAQRMASDGLVETRRAVHALRADTRPLHEELAQAGAEHAERYRVPVRFDTGGAPRAVPPDATVALLRTAQEALINAAKHAPGQGVELRLEYGGQALRLVVVNGLSSEVDAGVPRPATADSGYGLTGMRERLRLLRGSLDAGPRDDRWIVTADLPLAAGAGTESARE